MSLQVTCRKFKKANGYIIRIVTVTLIIHFLEYSVLKPNLRLRLGYWLLLELILKFLEKETVCYVNF